MSGETLFDMPEPRQIDPGRRVRVKAHDRLVHAPETRGRARATDPQTSVDAARLPGKVALRWRYLVGLVDGGPQTDFEVAARIGSQQTACGPRRPALIEDGYVEATGERRTAPSGATASVWRATPAGIEKAREFRGEA